jgi:thiamine-monophosphate kinase
VGRGQRVASEEALIQGYLAPLAADFPGACGLRDDAASLSVPAGEELVLTIDAIASGVHFFAEDSPEDIAWKALAVNLSDLIGKGARPIAYLMSLAFPEAPEERWLERFAAGLGAAQEHFGIALAGGDTDRRPAPLSITITAVGAVPSGRMVRRTTAKPGDKLFVSGTIGDAAIGLMLREAPELAATWGLDAKSASALVARYLRPEPPLKLAAPLREFASAAMDLSDGLVKDLGRMAKGSGVGAVVRGRDIPLSAPLRHVLERSPERFGDVVTGGDDYEVLAAVPPSRSEGFRASAAAAGLRVTEIGVIEAGEGVLIDDPRGRPLQFETPGWEHF